MNNVRRFGLGICGAALVLGLGFAPVVAQDAPKPDAPAGDAAPEVRLPTTDDKAMEMLKGAWERIESHAAQARDPLTRFASKATTKVDVDKVNLPRWGDYDPKAMLEGIQLDSNIAWTKGNNFSMHVHDGPAQPAAEGGGDAAGGMGRFGAGGVRQAMTGANTRFGWVLQYTIGPQPFEDEFKDCTFEPADVEDKANRGVRVWRNVLGKPISQLYVIDRRGRGMITAVHRDGKVWAFEYARGRRLQKVSKITISPDETKEQREAREKREAEAEEARREARGAQGGGDDRGGGGGRGGRGGGGGGRGPGGAGGAGGGGAGSDIPSGVEVFTFDGKQMVGGYEIWSKISSYFEFQGRRYPLIMTLSETTVNKDATDEKIRAGGFGESQGFPAPTRRDGSGGDGDREKPEDKKD